MLLQLLLTLSVYSSMWVAFGGVGVGVGVGVGFVVVDVDGVGVDAVGC